MDKLKPLRRTLRTYECVLTLPSSVSEDVTSAVDFRLSERLRANGAPFVRGTSWGKLPLAIKGKRKELQCCMHFWFKTNRPEASLEVIRNVCRNVKALKWAFYKTNCHNANVRLQLPIGQLHRRLISSFRPNGSWLKV
ncbi:MAG: hypothetical protein ACTS44_01930 [Candidatus Hodgkinia cicadicola]